MAISDTSEQVPVHVFGGPTALIEYGGVRFLTDPTFDSPGDYGDGPSKFTKTAPSWTSPTELGRIDAVLLSHDEHPDNLDHSGRDLLADVPLTVTTISGAERLGGTARGLAPWEVIEVTGPQARVTVTAVPALHGPEGCEPIVGEVIGFVLTAEQLPAVYVSGDNASMALVEEIADRFAPIDTAVLFAGAVRRQVFDGALLTLDSEQTAEAAAILEARRVVPVHYDSWAHFTEGRADLIKAFAAAGLASRLELPESSATPSPPGR